MKTRIVSAVAVAMFPLTQACSLAANTGDVIQISTQVAAYSVAPPHPQRGFFPKGASLQILERRSDQMVRVRFQSSDGRAMEGLCRAADLGLEAEAKPAAPEATPAPQAAAPAVNLDTKYEGRDWLEDKAGHDEAVKLQTKYDAPLLLIFYTDWNEECEILWKDLLSTQEFRREARQFIKLRINPEHGKEEGRLATKYRLRCYPTCLVINQLHGDPRRVDLTYYSFGKTRASRLDRAIADLMGMRMAPTNQPWRGGTE